MLDGIGGGLGAAVGAYEAEVRMHMCMWCLKITAHLPRLGGCFRCHERMRLSVAHVWPLRPAAARQIRASAERLRAMRRRWCPYCACSRMVWLGWFCPGCKFNTEVR